MKTSKEDRARAARIRHRVYRWAGKNAFYQHVTRAEVRWLEAYERRRLGPTWHEERQRMLSFAVAHAMRTVWAT